MSGREAKEEKEEVQAGSAASAAGAGAEAGSRPALLGGPRLLVLAGIGLAGLALWSLLAGGGERPAPPPSRAPQPPALEATQRANELSPEFRRQIREADAQRAEEALRRGGSALPTPVYEPLPPVPRLPTTPSPREEPPLPPLPPLAPEPPSLPAAPPAAAAPPRPAAPPLDPQALLQAMMRQAERAGEQRLQAAATTFLELRPAPEGEGATTGPRITASTIRPEEPAAEDGAPFPPAPGTVLYARLIGRANSDVPGPIVAEVLQGEYRGARVVGRFETGRDGLLMQFRTMTIERGRRRRPVTLPIEAYAVDPGNLGAAMATSVERREFQRIALAFATSFLRGLGQAIAQSGAIVSQGLTGTIVQNRTLDTRQQLLIGAGAGAGAAGDILNETLGNRPPTIIVEAGTPFGLLFTGVVQ